ncbi:hypothetical protein [Halobacterium zhouii]|uniref:hypothetical protein n=1 Tax=Halobacterium zhouii TaxID=2902624 RepID=UPI001E45405A|nr:hypothetical protein [Halobacterium zhouii]
MRALYLCLLVTALAFLALLAVATPVLGTTWTLRNRAALLAASLGFGAATALYDHRH